MVDAIVRIVEPTIADLQSGDKLDRPVTFTNGKAITYPAWFLDRQGHSLYQIFQAAFTSTIIGRAALLQMWRRVRIVPAELAMILRELQHPD